MYKVKFRKKTCQLKKKNSSLADERGPAKETIVVLVKKAVGTNHAAAIATKTITASAAVNATAIAKETVTGRETATERGNTATVRKRMEMVCIFYPSVFFLLLN